MAQKRNEASHIIIGNLTLQNPIICASSDAVMSAKAIRAVLSSGVAGVVAKSINESPQAAEQLNFADFVALNPNLDVIPWSSPLPSDASLFGRSGLGQIKPADWMKVLGLLDAEAKQAGQFVAGSIILGGDEGCLAIVEHANKARLRVLEISIGAPHAEEATHGAISAIREEDRVYRFVQRVRQSTDMQLWIKLSGHNADVAALSVAVQQAGAQAVVLTTRFMAMLPDPETMMPVLGTAAAYGGRWALPITCRLLSQTRKKVGPAYPLIGSNGARSGLDAVRMMLAGASAVQFASGVMMGGTKALADAIFEVESYLARKATYASAIVGKAADVVT